VRVPPPYLRHYSDTVGDVLDKHIPSEAKAKAADDLPQEGTTRGRTTQGLPVMLSLQQLAELVDPFTAQQDSHGHTMPLTLPKLGPRPSRVKRFMETLPIRNYAHDFDLWDMSADEVWERYQLLPEPRCLSLSRSALHLVLRELSRARPRTRQNEARYLSILNGMRKEGIELTLSDWSAAISYVGRSRKQPDEHALQRCIALWHEMEMGGLKADRGVFNNLLDVAVRAHRYQAIDVLRAEMHQRGIVPDRYTYCILITLAGKQRQGDQVRWLYREMVQAGEIVDIVVINSVIHGLLSAGEAEAAEHIYFRIRRLFMDAIEELGLTPDAPERGDIVRAYTRQFQERARENRKKIALGLVLDEHDISPRFAVRHPYWMAPNHVTLGLLLQHHCTVTGDFEKVLALLEDRKLLSIPEDQALYQALFQGFASFADPSKASTPEASNWTASRLSHIFESLIDTLQRQYHDSETKVIPAWARIRLTQGLTLSVLRAYGRLFRPYKIRGCYRALEKLWLLQGGAKNRMSSNVKACFEEVMAARTAAKHGYHKDKSYASEADEDDEDDLTVQEESLLEQSLSDSFFESSQEAGVSPSQVTQRVRSIG
jgi:hypothetical protein